MEAAEIRKTAEISEKIESFSQKELLSIISDYGLSYSSDEDMYRIILQDTYNYDPALFEHPCKMIDY